MSEELKPVGFNALVGEAMSQVQVFASAWSLVGGPFDQGDALEDAEVEKAVTEALIRDLLNAAVAQSRSLPANERVRDEQTDKNLVAAVRNFWGEGSPELAAIRALIGKGE